MPEPGLGETATEEARRRMLEGISPLAAETLALAEAQGRVLARPVLALRDQPPFDAASMDGYAVRFDAQDQVFRLIGESAAGRPFAGAPGAGETVRVFTGAATPAGCRVLVQERARRQGEAVSFDSLEGPDNVRPKGGDFHAGERLIEAGAPLDPWRIGLAAAAGAAFVEVVRKPKIAVLATGDEIVALGREPGAAQIFDSVSPALAAVISDAGGRAAVLGAAGDGLEDIRAALAGGEAAEAELVLTVGGASVGDHDLVKPALRSLGLRLSVESVRLRPGKPTWFGRLADGRRVLGLPGNPASALVCAELFLRPTIQAFLGRPPGPHIIPARLGAPIEANGPREHWARADLRFRPEGVVVQPFERQDSSLLAVFARAGCLIRRAPGAPAAPEGALVEALPLARA